MLPTFQAAPALMPILSAAVLKQICVVTCMVIVMVMMNALMGSPVEIVAKTAISQWEQNAAQYPRVKIAFPPRSILVKDIVMRTGSVLALSYVVIILIVMKALIIHLGQVAANKVILILLFIHFLIIVCNYVLLIYVYQLPIFNNLKQKTKSNSNLFQLFLVLEIKSLTCKHHHYESGDVCSEPGSTCWVSKEGMTIS